MPHTFPKSMKLCGDKRIHATQQGKRIVAWPLRAHVKPADNGKTQVLVWAPKSLHKHAVDRNRLRRLMREAYRLNSDTLQKAETEGHPLHIAIYNMDKQMSDFEQIQRAMRKVIAKIAANIYKTSADLG
jgi:ribonuclease P protein component